VGVRIEEMLIVHKDRIEIISSFPVEQITVVTRFPATPRSPAVDAGAAPHEVDPVSRNGMRTAVLHAPRKLDIVDRSRPVAGPGEIVVRTAATAVCHTDLSIYVGEHPGVSIRW